MVRPLTLSMALVPASGLTLQQQAKAQQPETLSIRFDLDSDRLTPNARASIAVICARPDAQRITRIVLHGHTDERGSIAYNEDLSRRRSQAVKQALDADCLQGKPMQIVWSGERMPIDRNGSEHAHAANRRVDVLLHFDEEQAQRIDPCAHPRVKPLIPALDKPRERHAVDPSSPIDLVMSDGVRVRIPADAIVDASGRPVQEEVEISYRSFNEPYEIIASGIPMHVATVAGMGHMETAGMYELYATANDERLSLAPGARISLERPVEQRLDADFVGWELDASTGDWQPSGQVSAAPVKAALPSTATEATSLYWNKLWDLEREKRPDTTLFEARRTSGRYCHLTPCDTSARGDTWLRKRNRFKRQAHVPEIRVLGYKGMYDAERIVFVVQVDNKNDKQFPDWRRVPHKAIWEYSGPESRAVFKRLYGRRHLFQDIHLDMKPGQLEGTLWLKENGEWLQLPVSAKWNRSSPLKAARWDRAMVLYAKALKKRQVRFDRDVMRSTDRYKREHADMPLTAWKHARRAMNESEQAMVLEPWREYAATRRPVNWEMGNANFAAVRTTFGLEGFGLYNIDRIMKMAEQQNVLASAVGPDGEPFQWVNAYAVLRNENSVITYWGNGTGTRDNLLVAPGKMKSLFLVDRDGQVARAEVAPLNSKEPRVVLEAQLIDALKSLDELRADARR
ncbi:MAG: OmpA family protein [Flavobacteriales bacterium]